MLQTESHSQAWDAHTEHQPSTDDLSSYIASVFCLEIDAIDFVHSITGTVV